MVAFATNKRRNARDATLDHACKLNQCQHTIRWNTDGIGIALVKGRAETLELKLEPSGSSLAEILVSADAPVRTVRKHVNYPPTSTMAKGLDIFRHARRSTLTRQMRAAEDADFQSDLIAIRDTGAEQPISNKFLRNLRVLSAKDIRENPARMFAPIAVLGR